MRKWEKRTNNGRVVYDRPHHPFKIKDVLRIIIKIANTFTTKEKEEELFPINAINEIWTRSFQVVWLRATNPMDMGWTSWFYNVIEPQLRQEWKAMTRRICIATGEAYGVPQSLYQPVMDLLYGPIWDVIWKITDPFFRDYKERREKHGKSEQNG